MINNTGISNYISELHDAQLQIFDDVVRICEENGLQYYLAYGTLLGAIRHKGFIPWDDDIDIAMPRKDYEKLIKIAPKALDSRFYLHCSSTNSKCWFSMIQICKRRTVFELKKHRHFTSAHKRIFIDIWPLDNAYKQDGLIQKLQYKMKSKLARVIKRRNGINVKMKGFLNKLFYLFCLPISRKRLLLIQRWVMSMNQDENAPYYMGGGIYGYRKEIMPKEKFLPPVKVEFEGRLLNAPQDWDYVLSRLYGDYMEIPHENERRTHMPLKISFEEPDEESGFSPAVKRKTLLRRIYRKIKRIKKKMRKKRIRFFGNLRCKGLYISSNSRKLASYKNKHDGERCFLIGNGPSLTPKDLDLISDEITFSCNMIYKIFDKTIWRPTYHCCTEGLITTNKSAEISKFIDCPLFTTKTAYKKMSNSPKDTIYVHNFAEEPYKAHGNMLSHYITPTASVMVYMLELAIYMGFKEIYLLGVDCTSSLRHDGHFIKNYIDDAIMEDDVNRIRKKVRVYELTPEQAASYYLNRALVCYRKINELALERGIIIKNATRGGALEVFERAPLESILER